MPGAAGRGTPKPGPAGPTAAAAAPPGGIKPAGRAMPGGPGGIMPGRITPAQPRAALRQCASGGLHAPTPSCSQLGTLAQKGAACGTTARLRPLCAPTHLQGAAAAACRGSLQAHRAHQLAAAAACQGGARPLAGARLLLAPHRKARQAAQGHQAAASRPPAACVGAALAAAAAARQAAPDPRAACQGAARALLPAAPCQAGAPRPAAPRASHPEERPCPAAAPRLPAALREATPCPVAAPRLQAILYRSTALRQADRCTPAAAPGT